ncbi:helix-turn-helix domain-containing protein [Dokdonella koreensis]|uniref:26 kDa repressor proteinRegulatory protein CI n=1 Tax=Dokdonella koreensis DS-123 TaxID=1300342 RepID=A0A160DT05_9GAMM|nr:helix-turn-helix domain-containing protein [Dokdonella koreensis]ANB17061.1 26 kDa repressor proteinRegulatory protein CI [Dokdonella koreensis DS-123]
MSNEKREFSQRLRAAMRAIGMVERPSVLEREFNANFWGRSVSFQAVSRWMNGKSIPTQDKLQVLAALLRMEPHALRYGERAARRARIHERGLPAWLSTADRQDRAAVEAFMALPPAQRKLARELIISLAKSSRR